jgi:hypothetical protein
MVVVVGGGHAELAGKGDSADIAAGEGFPTGQARTGRAGKGSSESTWPDFARPLPGAHVPSASNGFSHYYWLPPGS